MRMVGDVVVRPASAAGSVFFQFGIITLNDDAADALATPEPWEDPANWLFEKAGFVRMTDVNDGSQYGRFAIDSKSRRRLPQADRSLVAIMRNDSSSSVSLDYYLSIKALVLLG